MIALLLLAAQGFVGSSTCAACHPAIASQQKTTAHAHALTQKTPGQWAFGAGSQAITYVSQRDEDTYIEHGLSWYRKSNTTALTPGHTNTTGVVYRTFSPDASILRCFQCHSTGALAVSRSRAIEPSQPGVHCETCHGPGAVHAAKPQRGNIRNPRTLSASELNNLCGECHRMPPATGADINFENAWNVRHQPVYLVQSACFLKSGGKLSCLTCHSPHQDKRVDVAACSQCHARTAHKTSISGRECTSCHMPGVSLSVNLTFTNHWIGTYRLTGVGANPLRPIQQRSSR